MENDNYIMHQPGQLPGYWLQTRAAQLSTIRLMSCCVPAADWPCLRHPSRVLIWSKWGCNHVWPSTLVLQWRIKVQGRRRHNEFREPPRAKTSQTPSLKRFSLCAGHYISNGGPGGSGGWLVGRGNDHSLVSSVRLWNCLPRHKAVFTIKTASSLGWQIYLRLSVLRRGNHS